MENRVGGLAPFHNKSVSPFRTWWRRPLFFHQWKNGRTNVFLLKNLEELWLDIKV